MNSSQESNSKSQYLIEPNAANNWYFQIVFFSFVFFSDNKRRSTRSTLFFSVWNEHLFLYAIVFMWANRMCLNAIKFDGEQRYFDSNWKHNSMAVDTPLRHAFFLSSFPFVYVYASVQYIAAQHLNVLLAPVFANVCLWFNSLFSLVKNRWTEKNMK